MLRAFNILSKLNIITPSQTDQTSIMSLLQTASKTQAQVISFFAMLFIMVVLFLAGLILGSAIVSVHGWCCTNSRGRSTEDDLEENRGIGH